MGCFPLRMTVKQQDVKTEESREGNDKRKGKKEMEETAVQTDGRKRNGIGIVV